MKVKIFYIKKCVDASRTVIRGKYLALNTFIRKVSNQ